ncbi:autotransporter outer membrane beta-barrel domain-containing protein [Mixta hanseatica]|uniref:Autotransporter outer membrane beta-barrel domain-containing protein n=1 Tax=Mixta hanseatica TaxID=2872648 RepID=A0ABY4RC37_9GAMM|nr:autotransporter outer membrane beta-barrel domain-containing protein [Mixta hanseatica]UQY44341.1 autotransporter outer membrane beta-barrel domain-containing protein [Mixta hanseatica]
MITPLFKIKPLVKLIRPRAALSGTLSISLLSFTPAIGDAALLDAVNVEKNGVLILHDGDEIVVTGSKNGLCGICNKPGAPDSTLNLGNGVSINVNGPVAGGIMLKGERSTLQANQLQVNVNGQYGIHVEAKEAQVNLGSGSRIELNNNTLMANGIYLGNQASLSANALTINTHGTGSGVYISDAGTQMDIGDNSLVQTQGAQATGIYIFGRDNRASGMPASLKANRLTVTTEGELAYGMNIQANSAVNLGRGSRIETRGAGAMGIWNLGKLTADELHIKTAGGNLANALEVRQQGVATIGPGSSLYSENSGALVVRGEAATANFHGSETERNRIFSSGSYAVSAQYDGAKVNLSWSDIDIRSRQGLAIGIWAMRGGEIQGDNLSISGNSGTIGIHAMDGSKVELTGKTVIRMASPLDMALSTQDSAGYRASRISLSGLVDIVGSANAVAGDIILSMAAGSQLTGVAVSNGVNGGSVNINMDQSQWNMPGNSQIDNLTLHSSTVNFTAEEVGTRLTVGNLAGNGTFALKTDIVERRSDRLTVTGSSAGSHYLQIGNRGDLQTTGQEVLTVVETQDGQARFAFSPTTGKVELGGYLYGLQQAGSNWQLAATGEIDTPTPGPEEEEVIPTPTPNPIPDTELEEEELEITPTPNPAPLPEPEKKEEELEIVPPARQPDEPEITSTADAGANFLNINYLINYVETQTLMQRFGDLRQKKSGGNGWIRGIGGRFDDFGSNKLNGFRLSYSGMQFGVDKQIAPETPVTLGLFMGVTNGKAHYASGRGDQSSKHTGFYLSALADNGLWLDGLVKYARMKNSFNVRDSQGTAVGGHSAADSYSASLEGGKRINLTAAAQGFYLEPQLQLSWSHQQKDRLVASNGLHIDLEGYHSLLGRASALLGYRVQQKGLDLNLYLKSGIVREFKGDTRYRLNGSPERHSFNGDWWNNGLGVSAQIADQHVVYLEGDSSTGSQFNQRRFNAGYRFSF